MVHSFSAAGLGELVPQRADRGVAAGADHATVVPVRVVMRRVEVRDDHCDRQHRPGQAPRGQQRTGPDPGSGLLRPARVLAGRGSRGQGPVTKERGHRPPGGSRGVVPPGQHRAVWFAAPVGPQHGQPDPGHDQADRGDREPLVLLDEDQRQGPEHGGPQPAAHQRGQRERQQRDGERDLVEVEVDHLLQAPGEAVGEADPAAGPGAQQFPRGYGRPGSPRPP